MREIERNERGAPVTDAKTGSRIVMGDLSAVRT
jgi:hypothetical protein